MPDTLTPDLVLPTIEPDDFPDGYVPPLQNGDHLDADEFLRRYKAMPEDVKAELIDGIVYIMAPVGHEDHGRPHSQTNYAFAHYASYTPHIDIGDNSTTRLADSQAPQPDVLLRIERDAGGRSSLIDGVIHGPPELLIEVSASSASVDLNKKLRVYLEYGALEYLVVRKAAGKVDWFAFDRGRATAIEPERESGLMKSSVFPGLWLDKAALLRGDLAALRTAVEAGCQSPEHAAFVERLKRVAGDAA